MLGESDVKKGPCGSVALEADRLRSDCRAEPLSDEAGALWDLSVDRNPETQMVHSAASASPVDSVESLMSYHLPFQTTPPTPQFKFSVALRSQRQ